jgi:histone deacetylase complex regulatory component SIN3
VAQIKERFKHDPQIYREFLNILQLYKDSLLDIATVKAKVFFLFT